MSPRGASHQVTRTPNRGSSSRDLDADRFTPREKRPAWGLGGGVWFLGGRKEGTDQVRGERSLARE